MTNGAPRANRLFHSRKAASFHLGLREIEEGETASHHHQRST